MLQDYDRERYAQLVVDVRSRLRRACAHLPDDQFEALVTEIARVTARFWAIEANPLFWRALDSKDRPLAALPERDVSHAQTA